MRNKIFKLYIIGIFFLFTFGLVFGQTASGKLAGMVTDRDTGEPLIGANVIIQGTQFGAATDIDGNYFILNIQPGSYSVKVSYVGYTSQTIQNVRVVPGVTYELNTSLASGYNLDEIVVTDVKLFEEKATNTVKVIDSEQISRLPVRGISSIASLQSGVVSSEGSGGADGNASINVRGGRSGEVLYIIDGIPQNNVLNNQSRAQVSDNAIEQMSFQVGGYEAKYGQAQSGIINVTTKSGKPKYSIYAEAVSSSFTDDYGYNLYSANLSGPIFPGNADHTVFLSAERGWFLDSDPSAVSLYFESIDKKYTAKPNNSAGVWRFTARTKHAIGNFSINLGTNINTRNTKGYIHSYAKNNSEFFPDLDYNNYSLYSRISQTLSSNSFWNLNLGYRLYQFEQSDPHFGDNLYLYGDSLTFANRFGITLAADGQRPFRDDNNVFYEYGRINNLYSKNEDNSFTLDFDFTTQQKNHLLEIGFGGNYHIVRDYGVNPVQLAAFDDDLAEFDKFERLQPTVYGFDITGKNKTSVGSGRFEPKTPLFAYGYIQDRFELDDLVLNLGIRVDYFDTQEDVLKNPSLPFAGGSNPNDFDDGDFKTKDVELLVSPRIGLGFPVTSSTVFHAQYGRFVQQPSLTDLFIGPYDLVSFLNMSPQYVIDGTIQSEETTQYELGFRQIINNNIALNITAFYKNIKGLVNRTNNFFQRSPGGEIIGYIAPSNSDFGTTKGLALSLDVSRTKYLSLSAQYTFSIAEGTGSSTSSSQTAVFRNLDNAAPKVIAPLDFDQTHTATLNVDLYSPKGEGGILEMTGANILLSYNSGRPYTPLDKYNILASTSGGASTTGYVNSRRMPGTFRIDLKLEKSFAFGNLLVSPYLWIENLLDSDNIVNIYRSTGDAYSTGYLITAEGRADVENNGTGFEQDYRALERDPNNFGIPRLIKLGIKVNFSNIMF